MQRKLAAVFEKQIQCENVFSLRIDVEIKRNKFSTDWIEDSRKGITSFKMKGLTLSKLDNFPYFLALSDRIARNQASKKFVPRACDIFPN